MGHLPKTANVADYRGATAREALFGYLFLGGEVSRLRELFGLVMEEL